MRSIRILLLHCFVCALCELTEESETTNSRGKRNVLDDFNHPGKLIHVQSLQRYFDELDEDVQRKFPECTSLNISHIPPNLDVKDRAIFEYNFQEWWSLLTYSQSELMTNLKRELQNLTGATTVEEQAALLAHLHHRLNVISKKRIVYVEDIVVNESDEESVMRALTAWGLYNEKLLNTARAVYRTSDEQYSNKDVVWPRKSESG